MKSSLILAAFDPATPCEVLVAAVDAVPPAKEALGYFRPMRAAYLLAEAVGLSSEDPRILPLYKRLADNIAWQMPELVTSVDEAAAACRSHRAACVGADYGADNQTMLAETHAAVAACFT